MFCINVWIPVEPKDGINYHTREDARKKGRSMVENNTTSKQETMDTAACNPSGGNPEWRRDKNNN